MLTTIKKLLDYIFEKVNYVMKKPKPPIKFDFRINLKKNDKLYGTAIFHEQEYKLVIKASKNLEMMKIPFNILGIMNEYHLVRFSGITGAYTQYKPKIENSHDKIEIESSEILVDLGKQKQKYDTVEIFVN